MRESQYPVQQFEVRSVRARKADGDTRYFFEYFVHTESIAKFSVFAHLYNKYFTVFKMVFIFGLWDNHGNTRSNSLMSNAKKSGRLLGSSSSSKLERILK